MKNMITAAAIALATTPAYAGGLVDVIGTVDYLVEADDIETTVGVEHRMSEKYILTAVAESTLDLGSSNLTLDATKFAVQRNVNKNVAVYSMVALDDNFEYEELTLGLGFRF